MPASPMDRYLIRHQASAAAPQAPAMVEDVIPICTQNATNAQAGDELVGANLFARLRPNDFSLTLNLKANWYENAQAGRHRKSPARPYNRQGNPQRFPLGLAAPGFPLAVLDKGGDAEVRLLPPGAERQ